MVTIPKLKDLYDSILADLEAQASITIPIFGKSLTRAIASVQAAKLKLLYLALGNIQKNTWPDTADSEFNGGTLERSGRIKLGRNPNPATSGEYQVQVTGTSGAVIPASTTFKSDDSSASPGELFILDNAFTLVSGSGLITLRALTPGTIAKLNVSDTLTATQPLALVASGVAVVSIATSPIDAETLEDYRTKVVNAFKLEPQGGAATDYILWSQDAAGVAKVYPYARSGFSNQINLYVEAVVSDSYDGDGTPTQTILDAVKSVVEFDPDDTLPLLDRGRKPLTAIVNYLPITPRYVDVQINGSNFTSDEQQVIRDTITAFLATVRPFVAAADVLENKNDILNTNLIAFQILSAIPSAIFTTITMQIDLVSYTTFQFINGDIPVKNNITFP
jgi:hypothetical protein